MFKVVVEVANQAKRYKFAFKSKPDACRKQQVEHQ